MSTVPPAAIARFGRLKDMATLAAAAVDGLRPAVEHHRTELQRQAISFESAAREHGAVEIRDGRPVGRSRRERKDGSRVTWADEFTPVPELEGHAADLLRARERLAEARERLAEAGERAAGFRRVLEEAREALRERGWREGRP